MAGSALYQDLVPIELPLSSIYLDPNNPRFVGPDWKNIDDSSIDSDQVQEEARRRLVLDYGVDKLRMNMEINGYLPIDRIIVRQFKPEKYVVLEGNRRIASAKLIGSVATDGSTVSPEVLKSLVSIPCLEYVGAEQDASWIFQGLRHITGISEWSAYSKARLLVEQMDEEQLSLTAAGKRFGLSPFGAGQWVRGYYAFKQGREASDYTHEVDERAYPYFQELFSRSSAPVRSWLEWDDQAYKFKDSLNFNEFIGWLYPRPGGDAAGSDALGDFEKRRLLRRDDVRAVAYLLVNSEKYFDQFRSGALELAVAYAMATTESFQKSAESPDHAKDVLDALLSGTKALESIPLIVFLKDATLKNSLKERIQRLKKAIETVEEYL